ncbi:cytochrome c oxidase assembly factor 8 isoform X3 [Syngnathoides biaculeatus]|uniref:cytochrome c oxidase assembly factor 8 isoform X3 n=1 Tax=Syngnathoides biaculeatus TaxID=300417 RepID=UPI002ADD5C22|nr:cytochrome c oxidase assembly factor 8 isoform X3 [Syngnathoides biaculeatus]
MSVGTFAGCWTRHRWTCLRTRHNVVTAAASRRQCSELATKQQDKSPKRSKSRPAPSATRDWIGPPDPLSNLRPVVYRAAPRESELEGRLRNLRQDTEDWNHAFWTQQNVTFSEEKNAFVASQLRAKGLTERDQQGRRRTLSTEEMSVFYKNFLDKNRERHARYNKEWYRRNLSVTVLMARVALHKLWKTLVDKRRRNTPAT